MSTCLYVDGYNFYYAVKKEFHANRSPLEEDLIGLGWCDFRLLAEAAGVAPSSSDALTIKYFTAKVTEEDPDHDRPDEPDRQANWLSAVRTIPGLDIIWGRHQRPEGSRRKEKQTDVNIAVELVLDSLRPEGCEHAVVLSGDVDIAPAGWAFLRRAETLSLRIGLPPKKRRLTLLLPPGQSGRGWRRYFEERGETLEVVGITEKMLSASLLKYRIQASRNRAVECISEWRLPPNYLKRNVPPDRRPDR